MTLNVACHPEGGGWVGGPKDLKMRRQNLAGALRQTPHFTTASARSVACSSASGPTGAPVACFIQRSGVTLP